MMWQERLHLFLLFWSVILMTKTVSKEAPRHHHNHLHHHREKRQLSYPVVYQYVHRCITEANQELVESKEIDRQMLERGVDLLMGSSFSWHLGRFLFTKNAEKVDSLADKAWVTVRATKKLTELTGMTVEELQQHPGFKEAWRLQVANSCPFIIPMCDKSVRYRTPDGSCNNMNDPSAGAAYTRQRRMMDNAYDDGLDTPRYKSVTGYPLPSARLISNVVHKAGDCSIPSNKLTVLVLQFGQFIEHDIISTPLQRGHNSSDIMCCGISKEILARRHQCYPIEVPANDLRFHDCMTFVRATPGLEKNCDMGVRSPMNQATSYLDGSQIYGVDVEEQLKLRAGVGGLMKMTSKGLPPPSDEPGLCIEEEPDDYCMNTGDFRVNHVPGLTVMHTLFLRQHNRIATGLALLNLHWDNERVFQETRKIIIGILQHLVFNGLMPTILNNDYMTRYGLWSNPSGFSYSYDPKEDVSIMMGFSAAAMRFPHTRIPNVQSMVNKAYNVRQDAAIFDTFDKPKFVLQNRGTAINDFARWLITFPQMNDDRFVEDGVRDFLFLDHRGESFDLVALNLQRAREQGIPPYNHWRRLCGLKPAMYFTNGPGGFIDHDPEVVKMYASMYRHPEDVDIFTAGISEKLLPGGATGPTFACIIATQFRNLKVGDRFWYENYSPWTGFTSQQLGQIKRVTLAKLICDNFDIPAIQKDAFAFVSESNPSVSCDDLATIDLQFWRE